MRGCASQFFIAGELCRRGHTAVVTLGNTPNVDILCSNAAGPHFTHITVKTFEPGNRSCSVGMKSTRDFGPTLSWILGGIPSPGSDQSFQCYAFPSCDLARHVGAPHAEWLSRSGKAER